MKLLVAIIFLHFSVNVSAVTTHYDHVFISAGKKNGIDPLILKALAYHESNLKPFATNVNGESFTFNSLDEALSSLRFIALHPWMIKIRDKVDGKYKVGRRFYKTKLDMDNALRSMLDKRKRSGKPPLPLISTHKTKGHKPYIMARKLNVNSTDIGIAQINYRYHDNESNTVADWYDPVKSIHYQAEHLSSLLKKHENLSKAIAHYHSNTKHLQNIYMDRFSRSLATVKNAWKH